MKVLVTGGRGQLGQAMRVNAAAHNAAFYFLDKEDLDVTRSDDWQRVLRSIQPDVVINAAAYTAVEQAELHPDEAMLLNGQAAGIGAHCAAASGVGFIQLSTDYVFDGTKKTPYTEEDQPAPLSVYGRSKLEGETKVLQNHPGAWIIRLSWMYSQFGKNFMNTMLHRFAANEAVKVVNDQVSTPTCAVLFASHLVEFAEKAIAQKAEGGIYHYSLNGQASWHDLAVAIRDHVGSNSEVTPVSTSAYTSSVKRPAYSKLDSSRFKAVIGHDLPEWNTALSHCLN